MNFKDDDDYLWNATGTPDPDVQRLEQALGKLRYQPTELKLPAPIAAPRQATRATLYRNLLAAGVAFVMLAAGTWLYFRRHAEENAPRTEIVRADAQTNATERGEIVAGNAAQNGGTTNLEEGKQLDTATTGDAPHVARTDDAANVAKPKRVGARRGREAVEGNGVGARPRVMVAGAGGTSNTVARGRSKSSASATRAEGERAKRQLMLALYIASDKLAFVQKKVQGDVPPSPTKIEPERDLLR